MSILESYSKAGLKAVTLMVFLMSPAKAFAEDDAGPVHTNSKEWRSPHFSPVVGNLYFLGGVGFSSLDSLNDVLEENGYSELKIPALSLGLGADLSIGRIIVGAEWHRLVNMGTEAAQDDIAADINTKYWLARVGVDLAKWRGLRISPLFGIGKGTTKLAIFSENGASFEDVLAEPGREVRMSQSSLLLDASLAIDYRFKVRETERRSSFFTVGLRGGYLFEAHSGEWRTGEAEISGGPDNLLGGPTVQLLLGLSGENKRGPARHASCRSCSNGSPRSE